MDKQVKYKEKQASLETQRAEVLAVLKEIKQAFPAVGSLDELKHQILVYNLTHNFFDHIEDHVVSGPFFEVNFTHSLPSYFEKFPQKTAVIFKSENKILACMPKIVRDKLVIYYYEN